MANNGKRWAGGTFNIVKNNRLFGRYWGTVHNYKNLHFECCFYRLIDYSIRNGIDIFEAGAQGEHKFLRGFAAVPTVQLASLYARRREQRNWQVSDEGEGVHGGSYHALQ